MEDERFDGLARSLGTARSRRGALGLLAGAAGLALGADADAKPGRRGKPRGKGKGKGKHAKPAAQSAVCAAAGSKTCAPAQAKPGAVLKDCDYAGADFSGKALNATNLSKASLAGADLSGANLAGANLSSACLSGTNLRGASLRGTNLSGADLTGADLRGADLRGSNVKPAQLADAVVSCSTILPSNTPATCPSGTSCCGGDCLNLQTDPDNCGACGHACAGSERCLGGTCKEVRLAFITSNGTGGNLGGLAGADATCNQQASAAGLPGSYKAWLSDDTGSPSTRFTHASVPYVRPDNVLVANDWADLTSGAIRNQITVTASGASVQGFVWSNTQPNGTLWTTEYDCANWTDGTFTPGSGPSGYYGGTMFDTASWSGWGGRLRCDSVERFYCFQQ